MGTATRDFIPEGENLTPNEYANRNKQAAIRSGALHQDFIPDPEANEPTRRATSTPEERADRAMAAAVARAKAASDADWDIAITRLAGWQARQAIESLQRMPQQVMELYIIAEESSGHRHDILSVFPTPRPEMYRRYAPDLYAEKFEAVADTEPPEGEVFTTSSPEVSVPVESIASSLDEAPEPTVDPEDVFLCFDCVPAAEFKTAAGLKSHGRAKHGDAPEKAASAADETPQAAADVDPQAGVDAE